MEQRLAISRAILTKPELLILDEPINALDPEGIREMRELFLKLNIDYGTTILISSHILSEVEQIANTIGIIQNGKLIQEISMSDIHKYQTDYIKAEVDHTELAACILEQELGIEDFKIISENCIEIYSLKKNVKEISAAFVQNGIGINGIGRRKTSLEDYFFQITETLCNPMPHLMKLELKKVGLKKYVLFSVIGIFISIFFLFVGLNDSSRNKLSDQQLFICCIIFAFIDRFVCVVFN